MGIYTQGQWTLDRFTLDLGLRYDYFNAWVPPQTRPAGTFVPSLEIPEVRNVPNWKDMNVRLGGAYDLFGDGRTAIKASLGRYPAGEGSTTSLSQPPVTTGCERRGPQLE